MQLIKFSEQVSIAFHGLFLLSQVNERVNVSYISDKIDSSSNTVAKVFQVLNKKGLVNSERGPKGGFSITDKGLEISFYDIVAIFEEDSINNCPTHKKKCVFKKCFFGNDFFRISRELTEYLKSLSIKKYLEMEVENE